MMSELIIIMGFGVALVITGAVLEWVACHRGWDL